MKKRDALIAIGIVSFYFIGLNGLIWVYFDPSDADMATFGWKDTWHGVEVGIRLTTDISWRTSHPGYKITVIFAVDRMNGSSNEGRSYNNSHVVLNRVHLDPAYLNLSASPFKSLSDNQGWHIDWSARPNATDAPLHAMGIAQGKSIPYSLQLRVNYTVIDSRGMEWPRLVQKYVNITIVGGADAP